MKCGISILLAGLLSAAVNDNNLYSQSVKSDLLNRNSIIFINPEIGKDGEAPPQKFPGSRRVNPRALRSFLEEYKDFDSVRWYQSDKGSAASFIIDEVEITTYYDKYGNQLSKRKVYKENKLPRDVRTLVKRHYFDYEIKFIVEIIKPTQSIYVVTMEDKTSLLQIKVEDLEIEVVTNFLKSK